MIVKTHAMKTRLTIVFLTLACEFATALAAPGQVSMDAAKQLEQQYKGKFPRVRYLVSDSKVRYDAVGNLVGKWHAGRWTWHSTIEVTKVEAKDQFLRIKGNRLLLNYNRATHLFNPVRSGPVEIEIETSPDASGKIDVAKEWNKAFLKPAEEYPLEMQPYWRPFISCIIKPDTDECKFYENRALEADVRKVNPAPPTWKPNYPGVDSVGNGVTPPRVKSRVEPVYTDIARNARVQGTVILEAIIRKTGVAEIVRVIRPIGYGLEENAAEALSQWVFEPGTRMGQPVDVSLYVEVNFNLR
jgi:TonB family protein